MRGRATIVPPRLPQWVGRLSSMFVEFWHGLLSNRPDGYWPERHYMRGPGPKWHEKHGGIRR